MEEEAEAEEAEEEEAGGESRQATLVRGQSHQPYPAESASGESYAEVCIPYSPSLGQ